MHGMIRPKFIVIVRNSDNEIKTIQGFETRNEATRYSLERFDNGFNTESYRIGESLGSATHTNKVA